MWNSKDIKKTVTTLKKVCRCVSTTQCLCFVLDVWRSAALPQQWVWPRADELLDFPLESGL